VNIAVSGDRIAVASFTYGSPTGNGIYTFGRSNGTWTYEDHIPNGGGSFGQSLSLSGETLAVGSSDGVVFVYLRSGSQWVQQAVLIQPSGATDFAEAAALSGDRLVVSADEETVSGVLLAGALYIYDRTGTTWSAPQRLVAPDPMTSDNLGGSLAFDGTTLVAGADWNRHGGEPGTYRGGRVFVFTVGPTLPWTSQTFTGFDSTTGMSVALSGNTVAYGAPQETAGGANPYYGAVYILENIGGTWQSIQNFKSPTTSMHYFGWEVGLGSSACIVAAPTFHAVGTDLGAAYAYGLDVQTTDGGTDAAAGAAGVDGGTGTGAAGAGGAGGDGQAGSGAGGTTTGAGGAADNMPDPHGGGAGTGTSSHGGCACDLATRPPGSRDVLPLALLGLGIAFIRRRRRTEARAQATSAPIERRSSRSTAR
jgi:MYXO-CTERM domain-containing protein